ncbi:MAG: hypothetical protein ABFC71_06565 [Methanoregula sp.]
MDPGSTGFNTGVFLLFGNPVFGFRGNGVRHNNKNRLKWLFLKNNPFNRKLSLQFNRLPVGHIFVPSFWQGEGENGCRKPAIARYRVHVGEFEGGDFGQAFLNLKTNSFFYRRGSVRILHEPLFNIFHAVNI